MLSWSARETDTPFDLRAVTDPTVDPIIPGGKMLLELAGAVLAGEATANAAEGVRLAVGEAGLVDAAGVIGNFQMMNRVADATGMPVGAGSRLRNAELIEDLGFDRFDHLGD